MKLPHSYIPFYIIKFFISTFAINDVKLKLTWNYVLYNSKRICWYVLSIFPQGKIKDNILVLLQYFPTLSNFIYSLKTFQDKYINKMLFCFMLHSMDFFIQILEWSKFIRFREFQFEWYTNCIQGGRSEHCGHGRFLLCSLIYITLLLTFFHDWFPPITYLGIPFPLFPPPYSFVSGTPRGF